MTSFRVWQCVLEKHDPTLLFDGWCNALMDLVRLFRYFYSVYVPIKDGWLCLPFMPGQSRRIAILFGLGIALLPVMSVIQMPIMVKLLLHNCTIYANSNTQVFIIIQFVSFGLQTNQEL